jgi:hypothetical protein
MTKDELLTSLKPMTKDEEIQWMLALGSALTISARDAYVPGELNADPVQLMGFNELQHQIDGRLHAVETNSEWTTESFIEGLLEKGQMYKTSGGLGWAIKRSLQTVQHKR